MDKKDIRFCPQCNKYTEHVRYDAHCVVCMICGSKIVRCVGLGKVKAEIKDLEMFEKLRQRQNKGA